MTRQCAFLSSTIRFAVLIVGGLVLSQAQAAVDASPADATLQDSSVATHAAPTVDDTLRNTGFTMGDLQQMQKDSRQNAVELDALKETVSNQNRLIEELKRNTGTTVRSSDPEVTGLKSKIEDQGRTISQLESQLNDLKRNPDPSGNSSSSDISSLRQEISNLRSSVGRLESQMSSLSSKVK